MVSHFKRSHHSSLHLSIFLLNFADCKHFAPFSEQSLRCIECVLNTTERLVILERPGQIITQARSYKFKLKLKPKLKLEPDCQKKQPKVVLE